MNADPIVEATELSRWYGIVMGLNNVSFAIPSGITGLVGPNGAGKSTLIALMTGQIRPSSGLLTVFGEEPWDNPQILRQIGYCPEIEALHDEFKPIDWLRCLGMMSGLSRSSAQERAIATLQHVGLAEVHWKKTLGSYSKGMRQRVKLAQAMMHEPRLIVLDEPMNGLDPIGRQEMARLLKQLSQQGVDIIVSSHILQELESLCMNFLILNWGRVLASGPKTEIRTDLKNWSEQLLVRCNDPQSFVRKAFAKGYLQGFHYGEAPDEVVLQLQAANAFYHDLPELVAESGVDLFEIRSQSRSLSNIFERVTT